MLHEILLALLGFTGDVIVPVRSGGSRSGAVLGFGVVTELSFISASERERINQIAALGYAYTRIEAFVQANKQQQNGLYRSALCIGLEQILNDYRTLIVRCEQLILQSFAPAVSTPAPSAPSATASGDTLQDSTPSFPLSRLQQLLNDYFILFPALLSLLHELDGTTLISAPLSGAPAASAGTASAAGSTVSTVTFVAGRLSGGQILNAIYRKTQSGVPLLQRAFTALLHSVHRVCCNQITEWVVYGLLSDPFAEFFVQPQTGTGTGSGSGSGATADGDSKSKARADEKSDGGSGSGSENSNEWLSRDYALVYSLLPLSYFPVALAHKILFTGRAVTILLRQHPNSKQHNKHKLLTAAAGAAFIKTIQSLAASTAASAASTSATDAAASLQLDAFGAAIDTLHSAVSGDLWQLIVVSSDLSGHLDAMRDFLLCGRGEFYHAFVHESRFMFARPPPIKAERDLNVGPFLAAATLCNLEENPFWRRLTMRLDKASFNYPKFAPQHIPAGSSGDGIVLFGGAQLTAAGTLQLTAPPAAPALRQSTAASSASASSSSTAGAAVSGSIWHTPRKVVDRGFTVTFSFRGSSGDAAGAGAGGSESTEREGFAFVVQNDAVPILASRNVGGDGATFGGISNSISIEVVSYTSAVQKDRRHQIAVFANPPPQDPTAAATPVSASAVPSKRSLGAANIVLSEGKLHTIRVEYISHPSNLLITFDGGDTPAISLPISLSKLLRLEGGRAWLGFVSCAATASSAAAAAAAESKSRSNAAASSSLHYAIAGWEFKESHAAAASLDAWRNLRMDYTIDAPLDLILTRSELDRYNALFRFLFEAKRVQLELQQIWALQQRWKRVALSTSSEESRTRAAALHRVMTVRAQMQFWIDALQYHLQIDVIDVQHKRLHETIQELKDYDSVRRAHDEYLTAVTKHCFLHQRVISRAVDGVLEQCLDFARIVRDKQENTTAADIAHSAHEFQLQSAFLFTILSRKSNLQRTPHLAQLVLRLDWNGFYSASAAAATAKLAAPLATTTLTTTNTTSVTSSAPATIAPAKQSQSLVTASSAAAASAVSARPFQPASVAASAAPYRPVPASNGQFSSLYAPLTAPSAYAVPQSQSQPSAATSAAYSALGTNYTAPLPVPIALSLSKFANPNAATATTAAGSAVSSRPVSGPGAAAAAGGGASSSGELPAFTPSYRTASTAAATTTTYSAAAAYAPFQPSANSYAYSAYGTRTAATATTASAPPAVSAAPTAYSTYSPVSIPPPPTAAAGGAYLFSPERAVNQSMLNQSVAMSPFAPSAANTAALLNTSITQQPDVVFRPRNNY